HGGDLIVQQAAAVASGLREPGKNSLSVHPGAIGKRSDYYLPIVAMQSRNEPGTNPWCKLNGPVALKNQQPALLGSNPEFSRSQGKQCRDLKIAGFIGVEVLKLAARESQQALGTYTDPEGIWSTGHRGQLVAGKTVKSGVASHFSSALIEAQKPLIGGNEEMVLMEDTRACGERRGQQRETGPSLRNNDS